MENLIEGISGFILGLAVLAPFLFFAKKAAKEVGELLVSLGKGLEDNKLSSDEIKEIVSEAKDILGIFKK